MLLSFQGINLIVLDGNEHKTCWKRLKTLTVETIRNILYWIGNYDHCVESAQIRSFFWSVFFPHSDWIQRDTEYLSVFSLNAGKYGPEKTPYLDTSRRVMVKFEITKLTKSIPSLISCSYFSWCVNSSN